MVKSLIDNYDLRIINLKKNRSANLMLFWLSKVQALRVLMNNFIRTFLTKNYSPKNLTKPPPVF